MGHEVTMSQECPSCGGTGIYHGFAEPKGVGVVCLTCGGEGYTTLKYKIFTGLNKRTDIQTVRRSKGSFIGTGVGPQGGSITYQQFLDGQMP